MQCVGGGKISNTATAVSIAAPHIPVIFKRDQPRASWVCSPFMVELVADMKIGMKDNGGGGTRME